MSHFVVKSRRHQIVEVAARLFREKGYKATSMKDIAAQLDMEAASLYNHIKSKQEILNELVFLIAYKFENGMKDISQSSYSPFQKVKALLALHIRITTENSLAIALQTQDWKHLEEPFSGEFAAIRRNYFTHFLSIIKEGMEVGEIKKANPEIMLNSILSSVRWLYDWYNENREISPIELEIQIVDLLINGFKAP